MALPRPFHLPVTGLLLAFCLLLPQSRLATGQESASDEPAVRSSDDLAAIQRALDELPSLPPLEQKARAAELVETYYARYEDPVDYPEFQPIRDLRALLDDLERLPKLTTRQQAMEAQETISEYSEKFPGFAPLEGLKRIRSETEAFAALRVSEQQARDAAGEWARLYWQSRCCPLPPWHPPTGCLRNDTGRDVLYELCLDGIYTSRWMGPYRLAAGTEQTSPHPFYVRYLSGSGYQMVRIVPGEVYAFNGDPVDGNVTLTPGYGPAAGMLDAGSASPPAPVEPAVQAPPSSDATDEPLPMLDGSSTDEPATGELGTDGPMIVP